MNHTDATEQEEYEEYQYGEVEERDQGVSIESLKGWFPPSILKGRLPRATLAQLWERYPEPAGAVLKTSALDIDLVDEVPSHGLARDTGAREQVRSFATACKPIVHVAMAIQQDAGIPAESKELLLRGLRDAVLLHNHAAAVAEEDRRQVIGKALHWPDSFLSKCRTVASEDRAKLFGDQFVSEHRRWKQEKRAERAVHVQKDLVKSISDIKISTQRPEHHKPHEHGNGGNKPKSQPPKGPKGSQ